MTSAPAPDQIVGRRLQRLVSTECANGAPSCILRVEVPHLGGTWELAAGTLSRLDTTPVTTTTPYRTASITKTFTAAVVVQLAAEARFGLDDAMTDHLADDVSDLFAALHSAPHPARAEPPGSAVSIRHLLEHSSGLSDHASSPGFIAKLAADPGRIWTGRELLATAVACSPAPSRPDPRQFAYSDTGYVLLGTMIEHVCGVPLHEVIRARILDPLGLADTWLEGHERPRREPVSHAYHGDEDTMVIHGSADWAAGGLVSTAADLARFLRSLLDGRLLGAASLAEMRRTDRRCIDGHAGRHGLVGYGLGIETRRRGGRLWLGHLGMWGSFMYADPDSGAVLTGTVNRSGPDVHGFLDRVISAIEENDRVRLDGGR